MGTTWWRTVKFTNHQVKNGTIFVTKSQGRHGSLCSRTLQVRGQVRLSHRARNCTQALGKWFLMLICRFTGVPHSSFPNPLASKDDNPRESIEVRALVYYWALYLRIYFVLVTNFNGILSVRACPDSALGFGKQKSRSQYKRVWAVPSLQSFSTTAECLEYWLLRVDMRLGRRRLGIWLSAIRGRQTRQTSLSGQASGLPANDMDREDAKRLVVWIILSGRSGQFFHIRWICEDTTSSTMASSYSTV